MSPDEMIKRLDRFESILTDILKDIRKVCVMAEIHNEQIPDMKARLTKLEIFQADQIRMCSLTRSACPAADVQGFKRWVWGVLGAVILGLIGAWVKLEGAMHQLTRGGN